MNRFIRSCGISLALGGLLLILTNVLLTPMLPGDQDEAATRTSAAYLVRLSTSGVAALLLLFGCVGVHLAQRDDAGLIGIAAFIVVFVGNALVVAVEWANVFILRPVAQVGPEALEALGDSVLMTAGFASAAGLFALGWLLLAISILRAAVLPQWPPLLIIAGMVAIPLLGATPLGMIGAIVGNAVLGLGLAGLGRSLAKMN